MKKKNIPVVISDSKLILQLYVSWHVTQINGSD